MFQISLEFRKSWAGSANLGYQHMDNITKRVNIDAEKKSPSGTTEAWGGLSITRLARKD